MGRLGKILLAIGAAGAATGAGFWIAVRPWWRSWGVDPLESTRPLPGDEIIPNAPVVDTRAITIAAPPARVWPWLVQMGFGRGGWYSYDVVDMKGSSAWEIRPELQSLEVGQIVPTHPGGGFEARIVEPEHALVLYLDAAMVKAQAESARSEGSAATPANLEAAGAVMNVAQPTEFEATWAFVLEPLDGGSCRLIERFRIRFTGGDRAWTGLTLPFMGFGVFAMVRRQLLGIKARAER